MCVCFVTWFHVEIFFRFYVRPRRKCLIFANFILERAPIWSFQTLPDSWKNKKLLQVLTWLLKLVYYRDYLGKRWRNSKIHECQPSLENYRHWLLRASAWETGAVLETGVGRFGSNLVHLVTTETYAICQSFSSINIAFLLFGQSSRYHPFWGAPMFFYSPFWLFSILWFQCQGYFKPNINSTFIRFIPKCFMAKHMTQRNISLACKIIV